MSYKYALIENDAISQVIMSPVVLHFNADKAVWKDISTTHPSPAEGWVYDKEYNKFMAPIIQTKDIVILRKDSYAKLLQEFKLTLQSLTADSVGQSELYREKYEQAVDFLSSQQVVQYQDFPLLHIEAKILDIPMKNIAENIIKRRSEWISKLTAAEELRLYGIAHIAFCTTEQELRTLVSHIQHKLQGVVNNQ